MSAQATKKFNFCEKLNFSTPERQTVKGVIIALEKDLRIQRALRVTQNIDFYRYQVSFKLHKE